MVKKKNLGEMREDPKCLHVMPPAQMSEPCSNFFRYHWELVGFIGFISDLALRADDTVKIAAEALYPGASEHEKADLKESMERGAGAKKVLRGYRQLILETMVCRAVDNYLNYIAELLGSIFRSRPEMLRSNEMVRFEDVLQYSTMEDLIDALAEKRIEKLSYQGMRELHSYLLEKLGFRLFESDDDFQRAVRIIEVRNIIVHNRGIVNRVFKSRVPNSSMKLGERIKLSVNDVFADVELLAKFVCDTDQRAAEKFSLQVPISLDKFQQDQEGTF